MANALFTSIKKRFLDADTDLLEDTIKAVLGDADDVVPNVATHAFYSDIAAGVEETATLGSKTTTGGSFDAADPVFAAASGDPCDWVVLYHDTAGADSTDPLIAYYDTFSSGMPVTLNGGDVTLTVHASGFFSL